MRKIVRQKKLWIFICVPISDSLSQAAVGFPAIQTQPAPTKWQSHGSVQHVSWQKTAERREATLCKIAANDQEKLSGQVGDHVMVHNQAGNNPLRLDKHGVVVAVRPATQAVPGQDRWQNRHLDRLARTHAP